MPPNHPRQPHPSHTGVGPNQYSVATPLMCVFTIFSIFLGEHNITEHICYSSLLRSKYNDVNTLITNFLFNCLHLGDIECVYH